MALLTEGCCSSIVSNAGSSIVTSFVKTAVVWCRHCQDCRQQHQRQCQQCHGSVVLQLHLFEGL
jgi:hypothetical protein